MSDHPTLTLAGDTPPLRRIYIRCDSVTIITAPTHLLTPLPETCLPDGNRDPHPSLRGGGGGARLPPRTRRHSRLRCHRRHRQIRPILLPKQQQGQRPCGYGNLPKRGEYGTMFQAFPRVCIYQVEYCYVEHYRRLPCNYHMPCSVEHYRLLPLNTTAFVNAKLPLHQRDHMRTRYSSIVTPCVHTCQHNTRTHTQSHSAHCAFSELWPHSRDRDFSR